MLDIRFNRSEGFSVTRRTKRDEEGHWVHQEAQSADNAAKCISGIVMLVELTWHYSRVQSIQTGVGAGGLSSF